MGDLPWHSIAIIAAISLLLLAGGGIIRSRSKSEAARKARLSIQPEQRRVASAAMREFFDIHDANVAAQESRLWQRLENCPICGQPARSAIYAHVNPHDTHAEQIRKCISGHTWSRKMRLESMPDVAPVPPPHPIEENAN